MNYLTGGIIGLACGAVVTWLIARNRSIHIEGANVELKKQVSQTTSDVEELRAALNAERENRVRAETELKEITERFAEQRKTIDEAKSQLTDTFKALAADTLENSSRSFLKQAEKTFANLMIETKGEMGKNQIAIEGVVKPLAEQLKQFDEHVRDLEKTRQQAYTSLDEHIKHLTKSQQQLEKETGNLVSALRRPEVRGNWGEMHLKRVAELAGMSEHCDFVEQETMHTEDGRLRPDMVINLPGGRKIVVDSKVTLDAYLSAVDAVSDEEREKLLNNHARQFLNHVNQLGAKTYWSQFERSPEFVVMFVPGESFFAAALHRDPTLIEKGMEKQVVMATPTTFIALLLAVSYGWREEQVAKNAQEISNLGKELYKRMRTMVNYMTDMGKGLEKANRSYNQAVISMETRLVPAARRFKDLGATSGEEIKTLEAIETTPRIICPPELPED